MDLSEYVSMIMDSEIETSSEKLVVMSIARHANKNHEAFPAVSTISRETSLDKKTVTKCLKSLRESGFIIDTGRRDGYSKRTPVYQLSIEKLSTRLTQKLDSPKNGIDPKLGNTLTQNWVKDSPKIGSLTIDRYIERDIGQPPVDNSLVPLNVQMAIICRRNGISTNPQHPTLLALAKENIDISLFTDAVKECVSKAQKPNLNYLMSILKSWNQQAQDVSKLDVKHVKKPQPKQLSQWWTSDADTDLKGRELGLSPHQGESYGDYRKRLFDEIRKRETIQ